MDEQTKRKMIRNYFKSFPKWAIAMIVIGVVVLLIGFGRSVTAMFIGIVIAAIGGFAIYSYGQGKPSDQQMDEWLEEYLKNLTKIALNKMGTDETELVSESVQATGPRLWDVGGAGVFFRKGKDNVLRFTPVGVSIINFTQNQLLVYSCVLDFTTGKALNESTDEYFYKDVVSVATRSESKSVNIQKLGTVQLNAAETFTLTTSGGTFLSVLLRDPTLIEMMGGGEIPTTRAEKAIQTVRKMLREKKA
jgi:hypothetical protein